MRLEDAVGLEDGDVVRAIASGRRRDKITLGKEYVIVGDVLYRYGRTETTRLLEDEDLNGVSFPIMNDNSKLVYVSCTSFEVVGWGD